MLALLSYKLQTANISFNNID